MRRIAGSVGGDQERKGEGVGSAGVCCEVESVFADEEGIVCEYNVARCLVLDESNTVLDIRSGGALVDAAVNAHYVYSQPRYISMLRWLMKRGKEHMNP